jgi:general secretion pathway protein G
MQEMNKFATVRRPFGRRLPPWRRRNDQRREDGYTLVELLVVLAILALLVAIAAPQVLKYFSGAQVKTARIQIEKLGSILDLYRLDVGQFPTQEQGLAALVDRPAQVQGWNGPYLKNRDSLKDPWGRQYVYRDPGDHGEYDLYSLGADGKEGGENEDRDITNW